MPLPKYHKSAKIKGGSSPAFTNIPSSPLDCHDPLSEYERPTTSRNSSDSLFQCTCEGQISVCDGEIKKHIYNVTGGDDIAMECASQHVSSEFECDRQSYNQFRNTGKYETSCSK